MQQFRKFLFIVSIVSLLTKCSVHAFVFFPGGGWYTFFFCVILLILKFTLAAGILFAIAVPLELPKLYNVFMSYNFEANYRVPTMSSDFTKGPSLLYRVKRNGAKCVERLKVKGNEFWEKNRMLTSGVVMPSNFSEDFDENNNSLKDKNLRRKLNLIKNECVSNNVPPSPSITRKRIYNWIEEKLNLHGYVGKACLLRAICEYQHSSFSKYNGVLGDVLHIVFR